MLLSKKSTIFVVNKNSINESKKYQEPDEPNRDPKNNEGWHETLDESGVTAIRNRKTLDGDYSVEMDNLIDIDQDDMYEMPWLVNILQFLRSELD